MPIVMPCFPSLSSNYTGSKSGSKISETILRAKNLELRFLFCFRIGDYVNPIHATGLFLYLLKTFGFLFSGGIKRDQWHEIG